MRRVAVLAIALATLSGCRTPEAVRPLSADDPRIEGLMRALRSEAQTRQSLVGSARFVLDAKSFRLRRPQRVALRRPASMRVEVLALFGQIAGVLATHAGRYQYMEMSTLDMQEGEVTPDLLWRVARVDLSVDQAIGLLLAAPSPEEGLSPGAGWLAGDGSIAVDLHDGRARRRQRFEFDALGRLLHVSLRDVEDEVVWKVEYDDYRDLEGRPFPFDIEMRFPRVHALAAFEFSDVDLDPELPDEVFRLEPR